MDDVETCLGLFSEISQQVFGGCSVGGSTMPALRARDDRCDGNGYPARKSRRPQSPGVPKVAPVMMKSCDVGTWKEARFKGERVPTLGEVLAVVPKGKKFFIEIKCGPHIMP